MINRNKKWAGDKVAPMVRHLTNYNKYNSKDYLNVSLNKNEGVECAGVDLMVRQQSDKLCSHGHPGSIPGSSACITLKNK